MKKFGKILKIIIILLISVSIAFSVGFIGFQMFTGRTFRESVTALKDTVVMIAGGKSVTDKTYDGKMVEITLGDGTVVSVPEVIAEHIEKEKVEIANEEELKEYIELAQKLNEFEKPAEPEPSPTLDPSANPTEDAELAKARRVAANAIGRLSSSEIAELSAMMSGGLTGEEKERAKQIIYSKFSASEIDYYMTLYNKYGMSLIE